MRTIVLLKITLEEKLSQSLFCSLKPLSYSIFPMTVTFNILYTLFFYIYMLVFFLFPSQNVNSLRIGNFLLLICFKHLEKFLPYGRLSGNNLLTKRMNKYTFLLVKQNINSVNLHYPIIQQSHIYRYMCTQRLDILVCLLAYLVFLNLLKMPQSHLH